MKTIAVVNQKGGCGKTTTAVNLAAALAEQQQQVLLMDLDPQAHATIGFGHDPDDLKHTLYEAITCPQVKLTDVLLPTTMERLTLAPASVILASADVELSRAANRELILGNLLRSVRDRYDICVMDCAPSFGILTISALVASTDVIVPVQPHYYSMEGLRRVLETIRLIRGRFHSLLGRQPERPPDARRGPHHAEQANPVADARDLRLHGFPDRDSQQCPAVRSAERRASRFSTMPPGAGAPWSTGPWPPKSWATSRRWRPSATARRAAASKRTCRNSSAVCLRPTPPVRPQEAQTESEATIPVAWEDGPEPRQGTETAPVGAADPAAPDERGWEHEEPVFSAACVPGTPSAKSAMGNPRRPRTPKRPPNAKVPV